MANTTNLNLVKPAGTDSALISDINGNMDKIDQYAGTTNEAIANIVQTKILSGSSVAFNNVYPGAIICSAYYTDVYIGIVTSSAFSDLVNVNAPIAFGSYSNGTLVVNNSGSTARRVTIISPVS